MGQTQRFLSVVADINRMVSQEKRGGGTICFQDKRLWAALSSTELLAP